MGHLLKLNHAHSPLNLRIFSSTCVPFTLTTVQVPNLALTHKKRLTVCISVQNGMPHERENTRTGREKNFHSFISYRVGIVSLIWKPHIPVLAPPPSPSLQAYSMSISSHLKTPPPPMSYPVSLLVQRPTPYSIINSCL